MTQAQAIATDFVPVLIEAVRDPKRTPAALAALEATAREYPLFDAIDDMIERLLRTGQGGVRRRRNLRPQPGGAVLLRVMP